MSHEDNSLIGYLGHLRNAEFQVAEVFLQHMRPQIFLRVIPPDTMLLCIEALILGGRTCEKENRFLATIRGITTHHMIGLTVVQRTCFQRIRGAKLDDLVLSWPPTENPPIG